MPQNRTLPMTRTQIANLPENRCQSFGLGVDARRNQCALAPGHRPPCRNRSGRSRWVDLVKRAAR